MNGMVEYRKHKDSLAAVLKGQHEGIKERLAAMTEEGLRRKEEGAVGGAMKRAKDRSFLKSRSSQIESTYKLLTGRDISGV